jgi:hypothetical protein
MSYNVFPLGGRASAEPAAHSSQRAADVVDLAARRPDPVAPPPMPAELWDEIDTAARRWRELSEHGQEVRFHQSREGGRVRATLREVRNGAERALPLTELFGPRGGGPPAAA